MVVLGALLFLQAAAPSPSCQRALELHRSGKLTEAVTEYKACLESQPEWTEPRSNLGAALAGLGRYQEAISEYNEVLRRHPENDAVRRNLALSYYKAARIPEAIAELEQIQKRKPPDRSVSLLLADCFFRTGQENRVIEVLQPLADKNPDDRAAAYLLGSALIRSGNVEQGQIWVDRILGAGDSAEARMMVGLAKLERKEYQEAAGDIRRALEMDPKLPGAHGLLGLCLMGLNQPDLARAQFTAQLAQDPNDFESHFQLGLLEKDEGRFPAALERFERSRQLRPDSLKVRYQVAVVLLALQKNEQARSELESLVARAPEFAEAHASLATAYYRLKRKPDGDRHRDIERRLRAGSGTP
jgi:tetratricopeptide (TPR) repeat protein